MIIVHFRDAVSYAGSLVAIGGASLSLVFAQADVAAAGGAPAVARAIPDVSPGASSSVAILIALGGLASSIGPQLYATLKLVCDSHRADRQARWERDQAEAKAKWEREQAEAKAKWERHDLANKLDAAKYEVEWLKSELTTNRNLIAMLDQAGDEPSAEHPDPRREFREALRQAKLATDSGEFPPVKPGDAPDGPAGGTAP